MKGQAKPILRAKVCKHTTLLCKESAAQGPVTQGHVPHLSSHRPVSLSLASTPLHPHSNNWQHPEAIKRHVNTMAPWQHAPREPWLSPWHVHCKAPLSPEIHGETGLDSESGARGMPVPQRAAVPRKAVLLMFERISGAFSAWYAVLPGSKLRAGADLPSGSDRWGWDDLGQS